MDQHMEKIKTKSSFDDDNNNDVGSREFCSILCDWNFFYEASYTTSSDKREKKKKQNPICDTVTLPGVEGRLEKGVRGPCSTTSSFDILSGVKPPASNNPKKREKKKGIESPPMYISWSNFFQWENQHKKEEEEKKKKLRLNLGVLYFS